MNKAPSSSCDNRASTPADNTGGNENDTSSVIQATDGTLDGAKIYGASKFWNYVDDTLAQVREQAEKAIGPVRTDQEAWIKE